MSPFFQCNGEAVPFYSSCSVPLRVLAQYGHIFYHLFFPVISKQGDKIIRDHSLLNILDANPAIISRYAARGLTHEERFA